MKHFFKKIFFTAFVMTGFLFQPLFASAVTVGSAEWCGMNETNKQLCAAANQGAGYGQPTDPRATVVAIIKLLLTLIGTILFALFVYAGFLWMTAGGNEDQVGTAKQIVRNATIGLILVLSAYSITLIVANLALQRRLGTGASQGLDPLENSINNWFK